MFNNLIELIKSMPTEEICREYLAKQRWNGKTVCPYCTHEKCYTIEGGKRYKCGNSKCYKRFTVTVGTIFEASNISLSKWFTAIYLCTAHKRGISSYQLAKNIGVTQKSAWFMLHRIREALRNKVETKLDNIVEADETFVGGKFSNMHASKRKRFVESGDPFINKTTVLGMVERGGNLVAKVVPNSQSHALAITVSANVKKDATLITDSTNAYQRIKSSYNHLSVNHSIHEYVKGNTHTNTIEGAFSHFKRMLIGTYYQITPKHTQRYCDEFAYRFNSRKIKDADRFTYTLSRVEGRLRYAQLIAKPEQPEQEQILLDGRPLNRNKGILQLKDGEIVGHYSSPLDAHKRTGINKHNIYHALNGTRKHAAGYVWIYA